MQTTTQRNDTRVPTCPRPLGGRVGHGVFRQRRVDPLGLVLLSIEILHGLEVEQGIGRFLHKGHIEEARKGELVGITRVPQGGKEVLSMHQAEAVVRKAQPRTPKKLIQHDTTRVTELQAQRPLRHPNKQSWNTPDKHRAVQNMNEIGDEAPRMSVIEAVEWESACG